MNSPVLPDDTVTYAVGKLHVPSPNSTDPTEALHLTPCEGNLNDSNYEDMLPDFLFDRHPKLPMFADHMNSHKSSTSWLK